MKEMNKDIETEKYQQEDKEVQRSEREGEGNKKS